MAGEFTAVAGGFELFVAGGVDLLMAASEAVGQGGVADGRVQPLRVVVVDEIAGDALGVFECQRGFGWMACSLRVLWKRWSLPLDWE